MIHVLAAVFLVLLVLVQQGKGATMGAAFGSGASQTVFGSRGSGSFLMRLTLGIVIIFFSTSISLNYMASRMVKQNNKEVVLPVTAPTPDSPLPMVSPNSLPTTSTPLESMQQSPSLGKEKTQ